jgi:hypothetical protein
LEAEKCRQFLAEAGITDEQLNDVSLIEIAPVRERWEVGLAMIKTFPFSNMTQTRNFHDWYMAQAKSGRQMFGFQYKHEHFLSGES